MITGTTGDIIDRIFKEPGIKYELTEFESLGKPIHEILSISPKTVETGRDTGKTQYYLKSIVPFSSGKAVVQVYADGGKSAPEEIVRQLWVYKLIHQYGYKKGAPVALWSNGSDSIILYRPYPKEFDDTLFDIPRRGKQPVYSAKGLPVVNSKHVQSNKIVFEGNRKAVLNPSADLHIRYGDILMNGTGRGTIGRAAPYLTEEQTIPDNHVTILRSPTLDPADLSFYLNSHAGQLQVEMHQRGSSGQLELYPFDIRKFLVWVAPESVQKEIRNLYDRAAESEQRSRELLDPAKTRVEPLIEEAVRS